MKNIFNNFNMLKGIFHNINLTHLVIGIVIFGIWLGSMTNFTDKLKIMIQYKDHDPMCLGMDGWKIPLEDCYWNND